MKKILKEHLIDLLCTLVERRLKVTNEINLSHTFGDHFWVKVKKHSKSHGIHESLWFSMEVGDNCRPRESRGSGHDPKTIIDYLRTLLEGFNYGYNSDMNGIYFQMPDNYQTEILCHWGTPSFITDHSAIHYKNGRLKSYLQRLSDKELELEEKYMTGEIEEIDEYMYY